MLTKSASSHVRDLYRAENILALPLDDVRSQDELVSVIDKVSPWDSSASDTLIKDMLDYYSRAELHELEIDFPVKPGVRKTECISSAKQAEAITVAFEGLKEKLGWEKDREPKMGKADDVCALYRNFLRLLATVACSEINAKKKLEALTSWNNALRGSSDSAKISRLIMEAYKFDFDPFLQNLRYVIAVQALCQAETKADTESKFFPLYKALDDLYTRLFAKGFRLQWPISAAKANKLFSASVDFFMKALEAKEATEARPFIENYKAEMAATTWHPVLRAVLAAFIVSALVFGLMIALQAAMGIAPMVAISFSLISVANTGAGNLLALFTVAAPMALAAFVVILKSHSYYPTRKVTHLIAAVEKVIGVKPETVVATTNPAAVENFKSFMEDPVGSPHPAAARATRVRRLARQPGQRSIANPLSAARRLPETPVLQPDLPRSGEDSPPIMAAIASSVAGRRGSSPVELGFFGNRAVRQIHPGVLPKSAAVDADFAPVAGLGQP